MKLDAFLLATLIASGSAAAQQAGGSAANGATRAVVPPPAPMRQNTLGVAGDPGSIPPMIPAPGTPQQLFIPPSRRPNVAPIRGGTLLVDPRFPRRQVLINPSAFTPPLPIRGQSGAVVIPPGGNVIPPQIQVTPPSPVGIGGVGVTGPVQGGTGSGANQGFPSTAAPGLPSNLPSASPTGNQLGVRPPANGVSSANSAAVVAPNTVVIPPSSGVGVTAPGAGIQITPNANQQPVVNPNNVRIGVSAPGTGITNSPIGPNGVLITPPQPRTRSNRR